MFAKAQQELVLHCLRHIAYHCPQFIDKFFLRLFDLLPKLANELKVCAVSHLNMVSRVYVLNDFSVHGIRVDFVAN